jgi:predicted HicB family RNase H-like nuclease
MPEIRASVAVEVHRKLKEEAARSGKHLKELVAEILVLHIKNGGGGAKKTKKGW